MTKRITFTILAVVLGSTLIVGVGTTLLSFRSNRQQTRSDVASLTRNLADLARFSRTVPLGVSQDCDALRRPARKRACATWLAHRPVSLCGASLPWAAGVMVAWGSCCVVRWPILN